VNSASGSFEDFMEQFKKRHAKDYVISGSSVAVKAPMDKVVVKAPEIKPQVAKEAVQDRMSQAAGDDWADVWDDTSGEAEVVDET
jgi:hypothetical protein